VKLYVEERGSGEARKLSSGATILATSVVAYPEARSAFARRTRERILTGAEHERIKSEFERDWPGVLTIEVTDAIARRAGALADRRALRGFHGIHLASYLFLREQDAETEIGFSSFDERLNRVARLEASR
jgi:hypothetical protein